MNHLRFFNKKAENGITLIALIITIIILVILAAVSIRTVYNMGIVGHAINGTQEYAKASKAEEKTMQDTEGFLANALERIQTTQDGDNDTEDEPVTVPSDLSTYVLGAEGTGRALSQILSNKTFIDEASTIANASTSVVYLNNLYGDYKDSERRIYVRYNNVGYKIMVNTLTSNTTGVEVAYVPYGREGEIVQYSRNGTAVATNWLVLYDNESTLDITPVSLWANNYTLGYGDPNATGSTNVRKGMDSYENAVSRLNTYSATIVTNSTAQRVRSVGTQFEQEDTTAKYSSTFLENNPSGSAGTYNGVGKIGDFNSEQDVIRMSYYSSGGTGSGYITYGYANIGEWYWLASRRVFENSDVVTFNVRQVSSNGGADQR